jgi:type I restriction enzyme S subunit
LIQLADIGDGYFVNKSARFMNQDAFTRLRCTELKAGDLLIARMPDPLGRCCIFPGDERKCATVVDVCIIRVNEDRVDSTWLMHAINSHSVRLQIKSYSRGATRVRISRKDLSNLQVPNIDLAEQKRIAAILDKAAEIKAKREQAIVKLDELVSSVFEECCLLSPKQSSAKIMSLVTKRKLLEKKNEKVWSLALDQIESNTGEVLSQVIVEKTKLGSSTYYFEPDVVLYSKLRPYLNKVVIPEIAGYATTELVPLYCDTTKILPTFMAAYLRSSRFVDFANTNSAGAKMPRVMMDKFWDFEMELPEIMVQQKFQQLYEKCSEIKKSLKSNFEKQDSLIASLQQQAFTTGFNA